MSVKNISSKKCESTDGTPVVKRWSRQTHLQTCIKLMWGWKSALAPSSKLKTGFWNFNEIKHWRREQIRDNLVFLAIYQRYNRIPTRWIKLGRKCLQSIYFESHSYKLASLYYEYSGYTCLLWEEDKMAN